MKTKLPKTKILRVIGAEIYFQKVEVLNSVNEKIFLWEVFRKDMSALCREYRDAKFKAQGYCHKSPALSSEEKSLFPIPENFATELLAPYAKLEYANGHAPIKSFSMR